jgi:integrase
MATIVQRDGGWQAKIRRHGWPSQSKTFDTKEAAVKWARAVEREMDVGSFLQRTSGEKTTFEQAAERYSREVLPSNRGWKQDASRLVGLSDYFGKYSLASITPTMVTAYRDKLVNAGLAAQTTVHYLNLLNRILKACVMDWGIALPQGLPTALVRKPRISNERDRRLEPGEEDLLLDALSTDDRKHANVWMRPLVILAIETAGRQSELLSLRWEYVDLARRTARLYGMNGRETKNNDPYRDVPLSPRAIETLQAMPHSIDGRVFPISANAAKLSWQRTVDRARRSHLHSLLRLKLEADGIDAAAEIRALVFKKRKPSERTLQHLAALEKSDRTLVDLHFHDLRHEATSRLAGAFKTHDLRKVTGHKSDRMLNRYYHPRTQDLADQLDKFFRGNDSKN